MSLPYTSVADDPFLQLDFYNPPDTPQSQSPVHLPPLIVFVHGGAWRSEDKRDYAVLATRLAAATHFPVAVPNYRLTPRDPPPGDLHFRHPGHAKDIYHALVFLAAGHTACNYDPTRLFLIGHSCSAHMLASIFLDSTAVTPTLSPPIHLFNAVHSIILSEGIYDLDLLIASFPAYRDIFVRNAFGSLDSYAPFSVTNLDLIRYHSTPFHIKWLVIHSKGDTLVDVQQSDAFYHHLSNLYGPHLAPTSVYHNTDQLTAEHNDILFGLEYVDIVKDFILRAADK